VTENKKKKEKKNYTDTKAGPGLGRLMPSQQSSFNGRRMALAPQLCMA
jgi:hypothetical protein